MCSGLCRLYISTQVRQDRLAVTPVSRSSAVCNDSGHVTRCRSFVFECSGPGLSIFFASLWDATFNPAGKQRKEKSSPTSTRTRRRGELAWKTAVFGNQSALTACMVGRYLDFYSTRDLMGSGSSPRPQPFPSKAWYPPSCWHSSFPFTSLPTSHPVFTFPWDPLPNPPPPAPFVDSYTMYLL